MKRTNCYLGFSKPLSKLFLPTTFSGGNLDLCLWFLLWFYHLKYVCVCVCVLAHVPVPVKVGRDHENKSMRTCESQRITLCVSPCLPACWSHWLVPLLTSVPSCRSSAETKSPFYGFWRSELRSLLFVWQVIYQLSHLPSSPFISFFPCTFKSNSGFGAIFSFSLSQTLS